MDYNAESGSGIKLEIGYNLNSRLGFFLGFDGSEINADVGENYANLGIEINDSKGIPFGNFLVFGLTR